MDEYVTAHKFGNASTEEKLERIQSYLKSYSTALKNQPFGKIYIDAFAGTGERSIDEGGQPLFGKAASVAQRRGSANIALEADFDCHLFVENDHRKIAALENLANKYPNRKVLVRHGDANDVMKTLCRNVGWHTRDHNLIGYRGIVFLDPYGMSVKWETLRAIADTEALDCWYFFPLVGAYRNAPIDPQKLDIHKTKALTQMLGTIQWKTDWYKTDPFQMNMFGNSPVQQARRIEVNKISEWVQRRLQTIFKGWVSPPMLLHNDRNAPLANLFLCISNPDPKASGLARRLYGKLGQ